MNISVPIVSALVGAIVLFFGRKLFWLCLAALGFAAGVELAPHLMAQPSPLLQLSIALVLGFLGAILALMLQKLAVALIGFAVGGRLAVGLLATFFAAHSSYYWLTFLVGGVIGAIMLVLLFNWALILVSSLLGAYLIANAIVLPATGSAILFVALTLLGVIVQSAVFRRRNTVAD